MVESLLSFSGTNLFGHFVIDLRVVNPLDNPIATQVASVKHIPALADNKTINGVALVNTNKIVVWKQNNLEHNEIYTVNGAGAAWTKGDTATGSIIQASLGNKYTGYFLKLEDGFEFIGRRAGSANRSGKNKLLEEQLEGSRFARIYGFTFEGNYYPLVRPVLFLVHGDGQLVGEDLGRFSPARAPGPTGLTGLAAADFDFADGLRVWSYDKGDYTIRMDVEAGMFEDVLLGAELDDEGWAGDGRSGSGRSGSGRSGSGRSGSGRSGSGRSGSGRSGS